MKKIGLILVALMATAAVNAQMYVGGAVKFWHNDDVEQTEFAIAPEVGYNLNQKWAVGTELAFLHSDVTPEGSSEAVKSNVFAFAPYARYSFYENKIVRLFVDGGLGISSYKLDTKNSDSVTGFEIGLKPGLDIKLNDNFCLLARYGFLGYRDDYMGGMNGYGFALSSGDLSFGVRYQF